LLVRKGEERRGGGAFLSTQEKKKKKKSLSSPVTAEPLSRLITHLVRRGGNSVGDRVFARRKEKRRRERPDLCVMGREGEESALTIARQQISTLYRRKKEIKRSRLVLAGRKDTTDILSREEGRRRERTAFNREVVELSSSRREKRGRCSTVYGNRRSGSSFSDNDPTEKGKRGTPKDDGRP